jgi:hypothetical protein
METHMIGAGESDEMDHGARETIRLLQPYLYMSKRLHPDIGALQKILYLVTYPSNG